MHLGGHENIYRPLVRRDKEYLRSLVYTKTDTRLAIRLKENEKEGRAAPTTEVCLNERDVCLCATTSYSRKILVYSVSCVSVSLPEAHSISQESKRGRPQHLRVFPSKFLRKSRMPATCGVPARTHTSVKNLV